VLRGITDAAISMAAQMSAQDVIANNLANANTPGFKREVTGFQALLIAATDPNLSPAESQALFATAVSGETGTDLRQGPMMETGEKLHLAIEGDGFFVVQTTSGEAFTRDGTLAINASGHLATASGYEILGDQGPIAISSPNWRVDEDGQVFEDGNLVGKLRIETVPPGTRLAKIGANLFAVPQGQTVSAQGMRIRQGFLEGSNVSVIPEMVAMIAAFRTYEASQKAIQSQDQTLPQANDVGRVG